MQKISKFKFYFISGSTFLAFICIWFCFLPVDARLGSAFSIYDLTFGDTSFGGLLVAWLLMLLGMLMAGLTTYLFYRKRSVREAGFLGLLATILLLVSGILYACSGAITYGKIGIGPILNSIFLLTASLAAGIGSFSAILG